MAIRCRGLQIFSLFTILHDREQLLLATLDYVLAAELNVQYDCGSFLGIIITENSKTDYQNEGKL